jgi:hypothetical protein
MRGGDALLWVAQKIAHRITPHLQQGIVEKMAH